MSQAKQGPWALDVLGAELARVEPKADRVRRPIERTSTRVALALVALIVAGFVSLTPPGRAVAEDIAELVGIGDEPTADREGQEAPLVATGDAVVIATGATPSGNRYEMSAFTGTRPVAEQAELEDRFGDIIREHEERHPGVPSVFDPSAGTCIVLDFPDDHNPYGNSTCIRDGTTPPTLTTPGFNEARHARPDSAIQMEGMTGPSVESVEVTYGNANGERIEAPLAFGRLTEDLAGQIGAPGPMGAYVAFLPAGPFPSYGSTATGSLEVIAYGTDGEIVDHINYGPTYERVSEANREARCMKRMIEPYRERRAPVPLPRIQRECAL